MNDADYDDLFDNVLKAGPENENTDELEGNDGPDAAPGENEETSVKVCNLEFLSNLCLKWNCTFLLFPLKSAPELALFLDKNYAADTVTLHTLICKFQLFCYFFLLYP